MIDYLLDAISGIAAFGLLGIFIIAFVEKLIPILPSFVLYGLMGVSAIKGSIPIYILVVATALGSAAGSIIWYVIVRNGITVLRSQHLLELITKRSRQMGRVSKMAGSLRGAALAQFLPGIRFGFALIAPSGGGKFVRFAVGTFAGALVWSSALFGLGATVRAYFTI